MHPNGGTRPAFEHPHRESSKDTFVSVPCAAQERHPGVLM